jgi:hypothetical protein
MTASDYKTLRDLLFDYDDVITLIDTKTLNCWNNVDGWKFVSRKDRIQVTSCKSRLDVIESRIAELEKYIFLIVISLNLQLE